LITDPPGLDRFLDVTREVPRIALDTEADSLHCYFEKLCLIQIATPDFSELLDPLAPLSLPDFFRSLDNKEVVFHGADYDLRLLNRHGHFAPAKVFDTMLAARLAGEGQVGLAALVKKHFGVELSKASQKANWALRPLSQQMISYALSDVEFLLELADKLQARLVEKGRLSWLDEWIERMIAAARQVKEKDPEQRWRITGAARLSPRAQAVARALWFWRDEEARGWDRPPFYVLSNSDLLRIAEHSVDGKPFSTPRFPKPRRENFERTLEAALAIPAEHWPVTERRPRPKFDPNFSKRFEDIKARRDRVARELELEPALIAPKAALESFASSGDTDLLMDWQRALLDLPVPNTVDATIPPAEVAHVS
jgi:ribonuclease D